MDWKIIEIDPSTRVLVVELIILFEEVRFESSNRAPKRGGDRWLVGARARARERHAPDDTLGCTRLAKTSLYGVASFTSRSTIIILLGKISSLLSSRKRRRMEERGANPSYFPVAIGNSNKSLIASIYPFASVTYGVCGERTPLSFFLWFSVFLCRQSASSSVLYGGHL